MKCKNCGTELPENARFCFNCGTATGAGAAAPDNVQSAGVPPDTLQPASAEPAGKEITSGDRGGMLEEDAATAAAGTPEDARSSDAISDELADDARRLTDSEVTAYRAALDELTEGELEEPEVLVETLSADDLLVTDELDDDALDELNEFPIGEGSSFVNAYTYDAAYDDQANDPQSAGSESETPGTAGQVVSSEHISADRPTDQDASAAQPAADRMPDGAVSGKSQQTPGISAKRSSPTDSAAEPKEQAVPADHPSGAVPERAAGEMVLEPGTAETHPAASPEPPVRSGTATDRYFTSTPYAPDTAPASKAEPTESTSFNALNYPVDTADAPSTKDAGNAQPAAAADGSAADTQETAYSAKSSGAAPEPDFGDTHASADAAQRTMPSVNAKETYTAHGASSDTASDVDEAVPVDVSKADAADSLPPAAMDETIVYDGLSAPDLPDTDQDAALEESLTELAAEAPWPLGAGTGGPDTEGEDAPEPDASLDNGNSDELPLPVMEETIIYDGLGTGDAGGADDLLTETLDGLAEETPPPLGISDNESVEAAKAESENLLAAESPGTVSSAITPNYSAGSAQDEKALLSAGSSDDAVNAALGFLEAAAEELPDAVTAADDTLSDAAAQGQSVAPIDITEVESAGSAETASAPDEGELLNADSFDDAVNAAFTSLDVSAEKKPDADTAADDTLSDAPNAAAQELRDSAIDTTEAAVFAAADAAGAPDEEDLLSAGGSDDAVSAALGFLEAAAEELPAAASDDTPSVVSGAAAQGQPDASLDITDVESVGNADAARVPDEGELQSVDGSEDAANAALGFLEASAEELPDAHMAADDILSDASNTEAHKPQNSSVRISGEASAGISDGAGAPDAAAQESPAKSVETEEEVTADITGAGHELEMASEEVSTEAAADDSSNADNAAELSAHTEHGAQSPVMSEASDTAAYAVLPEEPVSEATAAAGLSEDAAAELPFGTSGIIYGGAEESDVLADAEEGFVSAENDLPGITASIEEPGPEPAGETAPAADSGSGEPGSIDAESDVHKDTLPDIETSSDLGAEVNTKPDFVEQLSAAANDSLFATADAGAPVQETDSSYDDEIGGSSDAEGVEDASEASQSSFSTDDAQKLRFQQETGISVSDAPAHPGKVVSPAGEPVSAADASETAAAAISRTDTETAAEELLSSGTAENLEAAPEDSITANPADTETSSVRSGDFSAAPHSTDVYAEADVAEDLLPAQEAGSSSAQNGPLSDAEPEFGIEAAASLAEGAAEETRMNLTGEAPHADLPHTSADSAMSDLTADDAEEQLLSAADAEVIPEEMADAEAGSTPEGVSSEEQIRGTDFLDAAPTPAAETPPRAADDENAEKAILTETQEQPSVSESAQVSAAVPPESEIRLSRSLHLSTEKLPAEDTDRADASAAKTVHDAKLPADDAASVHLSETISVSTELPLAAAGETYSAAQLPDGVPAATVTPDPAAIPNTGAPGRTDGMAEEHLTGSNEALTAEPVLAVPQAEQIETADAELSGALHDTPGIVGETLLVPEETEAADLPAGIARSADNEDEDAADTARTGGVPAPGTEGGQDSSASSAPGTETPASSDQQLSSSHTKTAIPQDTPGIDSVPDTSEILSADTLQLASEEESLPNTIQLENTVAPSAPLPKEGSGPPVDGLSPEAVDSSIETHIEAAEPAAPAAAEVPEGAPVAPQTEVPAASPKDGAAKTPNLTTDLSEAITVSGGGTKADSLSPLREPETPSGTEGLLPDIESEKTLRITAAQAPADKGARDVAPEEAILEEDAPAADISPPSVPSLSGSDASAASAAGELPAADTEDVPNEISASVSSGSTAAEERMTSAPEQKSPDMVPPAADETAQAQNAAVSAKSQAGELETAAAAGSIAPELARDPSGADAPTPLQQEPETAPEQAETPPETADVLPTASADAESQDRAAEAEAADAPTGAPPADRISLEESGAARKPAETPAAEQALSAVPENAATETAAAEDPQAPKAPAANTISVEQTSNTMPATGGSGRSGPEELTEASPPEEPSPPESAPVNLERTADITARISSAAAQPPDVAGQDVRMDLLKAGAGAVSETSAFAAGGSMAEETSAQPQGADNVTKMAEEPEKTQEDVPAQTRPEEAAEAEVAAAENREAEEETPAPPEPSGDMEPALEQGSDTEQDGGDAADEEEASEPPKKRPKKARPPRPKRSFSETAGSIVQTLRNLPAKWMLVLCGIALAIGVGIVFYGLSGTSEDVVNNAVNAALAGSGTGALASVTSSKTALYAGIPILVGGLIALVRALMLFLEERSSASSGAAAPEAASEETPGEYLEAAPEAPSGEDLETAVDAAVPAERQRFWTIPLIVAEAVCAIAAFGIPMLLHTRAAGALDGHWAIDVPKDASAKERFVLMDSVPRAMEMNAAPDYTGITYSEFDGNVDVADVRWEEPNGYSYDWFLLYPYTEGDVSQPLAALNAASVNDIGMRVLTGDGQVDAQFERIAVSDWRQYVAAEAPLPDATFDLTTPPPAASGAAAPGYTFTPYTFAPADAQMPAAAEPPELTPPPDAAQPLEAGATVDATGDGALDSISVASDGTTVTLSINGTDIPLSFVPDPAAVYQVYVVDADPNDGVPEIIVQGLHEGYSSAHVYRYTTGDLQTVTATYSVPFAVLMEGAQPEGVSSILYDDKSYLIVPGDGSILFPVGNYGGALRLSLTDLMHLKQEPENSGVLIPEEQQQAG